MNHKTELDYILRVSDIHAADREIVISANADEREAIAGRFSLLHLEAFEAECKAAHWRKRGVSLSGRIKARLEQSCNVTLEPVAEEIDVPFRALFWPAKYALELPDEGIEGEVFSDISSDDSPELFENDEINAGEAVLEYFALAINPYPKKAGAEAPEFEAKTEIGGVKPSPFHVLKGLHNGGE